MEFAGDGNGMALKVAKSVPVLLRLAELLMQRGDLKLMGAEIEVAEDGVGFAIEPLPGDATLLGVVGDVAVGSEEDDRSTGKTGRWDYHVHGVSLCQDAVGGTSTSLQLLAPFCPLVHHFLSRIEKVPPAELSCCIHTAR